MDRYNFSKAYHHKIQAAKSSLCLLGEKEVHLDKNAFNLKQKNASNVQWENDYWDFNFNLQNLKKIMVKGIVDLKFTIKSTHPHIIHWSCQNEGPNSR